MNWFCLRQNESDQDEKWVMLIITILFMNLSSEFFWHWMRLRVRCLIIIIINCYRFDSAWCIGICTVGSTQEHSIYYMQFDTQNERYYQKYPTSGNGFCIFYCVILTSPNLVDFEDRTERGLQIGSPREGTRYCAVSK